MERPPVAGNWASPGDLVATRLPTAQGHLAPDISDIFVCPAIVPRRSRGPGANVLARLCTQNLTSPRLSTLR